MITGNKNRGNGGGVYLSGDGSRFIMSGGEISGNIVQYGGGGIFAGPRGAVTIMDGSAITGNYAYYEGGGISMGHAYVQADLASKVEMKGGIVSGNTTGGHGGGLYTFYNSTFYMSGGIIYGSDAAPGLANIMTSESEQPSLGAAMRFRCGAPCSAVAEWGSYQSGIWQPAGTFGPVDCAEENTVEVVNGERK